MRLRLHHQHHQHHYYYYYYYYICWDSSSFSPPLFFTNSIWEIFGKLLQELTETVRAQCLCVCYLICCIHIRFCRETFRA